MTAKPPILPLKVILYEAAGSEPLEKGFKVELMSTLLDDGIGVYSVQQGSEIDFDGKETLCVVGEFETQPVKSELDFISVKQRSAKEVLAEIQIKADSINERRTLWKPWFPVIDYDRCTNCMQCLTFCLFDVYSVKESQITVTNEDKCKTDCPACSRVCPEVAILFPKYSKGPINGDVVKEEDIKREKMKVDISSLLGGDILSKLRTRHVDAKQRFSKERDEGKALRERERCLKKLKEDLDIPDSVLKSLPTQMMIDAKTKSMEEND